MRYVVHYPGDGCDIEPSHEGIEADSKENVIQKIRDRIEYQNKQNEQHDKYRDAFKFSLGDRPQKPKFGRRADDYRNDREKEEMKIALREHVKKCQEFQKTEALYSMEFLKYMEKCPYTWAANWMAEVPALENIYEFPDEYWDKLLTDKEE